MTADQFRRAQASLGLTNRELAEVLMMSVRMVEDMRSGRRRVSRRTELILGLAFVGIRPSAEKKHTAKNNQAEQ